MKRDVSPALDLVLRFRRVLSLVAQLGLVALSNRLAFSLRFDDGVPAWALAAFWQTLPALILVRGLTFLPFRLYEGLWRYTSLYDLQMLLGGIATSSLIFVAAVKSPLGPSSYPRSVFIIDAIVLTIFLGGLRLTRRFVAEYSRARPGKRVLIFGAGDAGELIVRDMKNNSWYGLRPIGFVDDDRSKAGRRIHGVPVLGGREALHRILKDVEPDEVLIAIPRADPATIRSIVRALEPFKLPIKTLPHLRDIIDGKVEIGQIRSLAVEDLLTRAPVGLDMRPVRHLIADRRIMVTGAGGSIGAELCRQIASLRPAALVMLDRYENGLHEIRLELADRVRGVPLHAVIADVSDGKRVDEVLSEFRPDIIFHAAAHKHVPLMEENPCEAVKNNIRGTGTLALAADAHGVDRFIMISTDKAVNPTSVMGMSKRIAEMVVRAQAQGSGTSFSIVRFGNVLGSNGSVVPRFMDQIKRGGPVTITHPDMRRFFMLIPEAVLLVLHAAAQAESGVTYVLEMGEQVRLLDMARDLIRLSGFVPEDDIKIEFVGLRPGEKLYEELVGPDERALPSGVDKILCVRSVGPLDERLAARIEQLEDDARDGRKDAVLAAMRELAVTSESLVAMATVTTMPATVDFVLPSVKGEHSCPRCLSDAVHRSRAKGLAERMRKGFTTRRLYRCEVCKWRGWLTPMHFESDPVAEPAPVLNLDTVDVSLGRSTKRRGSFSPRQLQ